jgi:hypothetical protein
VVVTGQGRESEGCTGQTLCEEGQACIPQEERWFVMALERPARTELRDQVTAVFAGVHMEEPLWIAVSNAFEWENAWPEVDGDCDLTGNVLCNPKEDYLTCFPSWDAVIHSDTAIAAGWTVDREQGHATPPEDE